MVAARVPVDIGFANKQTNNGSEQANEIPLRFLFHRAVHKRGGMDVLESAEHVDDRSKRGEV